MMEEFAKQLDAVNNKKYDARQWKIKCVILSLFLSFLLIDKILAVLRTSLTWPPNALSRHIVTRPTLIQRTLNYMSRRIVMRWDW